MRKRFLAIGLVAVLVGAAHSSEPIPLMKAVEQGDLLTVQRLLASGAQVNAKTDRGVTALMVAATSRRTDAIQLLLKAGADPNATTAAGFDALMLAAFVGDLKSVEALLQAGAKPEKADDNGWTALTWAEALLMLRGTEAGTPVLEVLKRSGAKPGVILVPERIVDAIMAGDRGTIERYLRSGGNPNVTSGKGTTLLDQAALSGKLEVVDLLLVAGAEVNRQSSLRPFAVAYAAHGENNVVIEPLEEAAESHSPAATALMSASRWGHVEVVRRLLAAGADVNASSGGGTALYLTTQDRPGHVEAARLLISAGANVNAVDSHGMTALMSAARHDDVEMVKLLLSAGAKVDIEDSEGKTAIEWAERSPEVLKILRQAATAQGSKSK